MEILLRKMFTLFAIVERVLRGNIDAPFENLQQQQPQKEEFVHCLPADECKAACN